MKNIIAFALLIITLLTAFSGCTTDTEEPGINLSSKASITPPDRIEDGTESIYRITTENGSIAEWKVTITKFGDAGNNFRATFSGAETDPGTIILSEGYAKLIITE